MKISVRFKKEDLWIGIYWDSDHLCFTRKLGKSRYEIFMVNVYVCFVPMVPIHIRFQLKFLAKGDER